MKRKWRRSIVGGLSFTSALFIFQACYGMPQDYYPEIRYSGLVKSKTSGEPIEGIKVSIGGLDLSDRTNEQGEFLLFSDVVDRVLLRFEDVDSTENGVYSSKDTLLLEPAEESFLEIELEEK